MSDLDEERKDPAFQKMSDMVIEIDLASAAEEFEMLKAASEEEE